MRLIGFVFAAIMLTGACAAEGGGGINHADLAPPGMDMTQPCAGLGCAYYAGGGCYCSCGGYPPLVECGSNGSCNCDNVKIVNGGQCASLADATRIYFLCLPY